MYKLIGVLSMIIVFSYYHWSLYHKVNQLTEYMEASVELDETKLAYSKTMSEYNNRVLEYNNNLAPGALKQATK